MTLSRSLIGSLLLVNLALAPAFAHAFEVPPNDGFVTDTADMFTAEGKAAIERKLTDYRQATSNEIAVVTVPSLDGEAIEEVGLQIARKWGVGSEKNNGILILVAYQEREVRFDVGYGLEGAVPDIVAKGIIDEDIVPHFRDGDYSGGVVASIDSLQKHIGGEYTADRYAEPSDSGFPPVLLFVGFIALQWLIAVLGRTKSWWLGGVFGGIAGLGLAIAYAWWLSIPILVVLGLFLDFVVSRNFKRRGTTKWWAGGGWGPGGGFGSGGGGGGFGGFGGGSFGGGGASGRW